MDEGDEDYERENSKSVSTGEDECKNIEDGKEDTHEESSSDKEGGEGEKYTMTEDNFLHMLLNLAGGDESIFI